ncbi:GNAT superfamily N-acetyltransferase [Saccharothrix tamanrassetensis]|uniref:GNAT superfamily N-acetyltransferase n=1 Tax=Saccharothrix tamanrassetensis TaxID=1051531 RepID=A0A841CIJ9_9PSEU|nr:GNAT family N-acetyltransferase [Saccharothrix tamanrassetensis]MBB5955957.1 GNAT superfamily N-acetyltransferase [Saccharothrix tamanrassetensis]
MTVSRGLVEAQGTRFACLDPLLPAMAPPPDGDVITAALPDGSRVAGVLQRQVHDRMSAARLWSATEVWELTPLLGAAGAAGMDALLRAWRGRMDRVGPAERDSACVLTWPSRDAEATRALLDHGLVPLSVIAVRRHPPVPGPRRPQVTDTPPIPNTPPVPNTSPVPNTPPVRNTPPVPGALVIRRATPADVDSVLNLALAELRYSAMVGSTVDRPEAAGLKRRTLAERLAAGGPAWLAERDGIAVALAECALVTSEPGNWTSTRLPTGRWGYVNCVSVLPGARGGGIGQRLMAHAHRELHRLGTVGTYLYYNPPNPLSSVFWPRQGYRPLWTVWEVRPAGALR